MTAITIRPAKPQDANAIAIVHVASWRTTYRGIVPDSFLASISVEKRQTMWEQTIAGIAAGTMAKAVFVAEGADSKIVGFVAGGEARGEHAKLDGELYAIYLYMDQQKRGLGRRLTHALAERLLSLNYRGMMLWVLENNPSRNFYESIGGQLLPDTKEIDFGGTKCIEVAYGWNDLRLLTQSLSQGPGTLTLERVDHSAETLVHEILAAAPTYTMNTDGVASIPDDGRDTLTALPPNCTMDQKHVLVLREAGIPVGVADVIQGFPEPGTAFLGLMLLREDSQRKGLGRSFYGKIEDMVVGTLGCKKIRLAVVDSNPVVPFWERMGFTMTGEVRPHEGKKLKSIKRVMEKMLT